MYHIFSYFFIWNVSWTTVIALWNPPLDKVYNRRLLSTLPRYKSYTPHRCGQWVWVKLRLSWRNPCQTVRNKMKIDRYLLPTRATRIDRGTGSLEYISTYSLAALQYDKPNRSYTNFVTWKRKVGFVEFFYFKTSFTYNKRNDTPFSVVITKENHLAY